MLRTIALAAAFAWSTQAASDLSITVSAAVSLTEVMKEIAQAHQASGGRRVVFNFGASNILARQIVNGAPVDVFISADQLQMDVVARGGMVAAGTLTAVAGNRLAIVEHRERNGGITSAAALKSAAVRRIAVGDPDAVPAGVYAKHYLERAGLWRSLQPKLLPSASVRAALTSVANGAADAAIVYATDARVEEAVRVALVISGPDAPAIVYPACVVESSRKKDAAAAFVKFLRSAEALRLFEHYGFSQPPGTR